MAEGGRPTSQKCRYYSRELCPSGSRCPLPHCADASDVCRYFIQGRCAYGSSCRFKHSSSDNNPQISETSNSNNTGTKDSDTHSSTSQSKPNNADQVTWSQRQVTGLKSKDTWVNAPEFIPRAAAAPKSYAQALCDSSQEIITPPEYSFCPNAMETDPPCGPSCPYQHFEICDLCSYRCLDPTDSFQTKKHKEECMREHERDMELSFAIARSKDKACGICMDVIMEKSPLIERRFGILANCNHVFCLACIRKWRCAKQFDSKTVRSCPECRQASDFVTPSKYWVDTKDEKQKLINDYKKALSLKQCKYFKQGQGECPFAGNCFYLHAYPDGRKVDLPPPRPRRRRNQDGDLELLQRIVLWDFIEERDNRWLLHLDLDDMLELFDDSDDSDYNDYDLLESVQ